MREIRGDDDIGDYKYIGRVAPLAEIGEYTVDASTTIYITDDAEAAGGVLAGAGIAMSAFCCGGGFLVLGLILGLTIKDDKHTAVVMQQPGMVPVVAQPGIVPMVAQPGVVPVMAQPQVALPTTSIEQLTPQAAATGAANPAAMSYYQGLVQQGYDAQTALTYTAQHFPGWQP